MSRKSGQEAKKLGRAIRTLRQKKSRSKRRITSQAEFGEKAGFNRAYIWGIENGLRNISLANLVAIARALGVSPSVLLRKAGL